MTKKEKELPVIIFVGKIVGGRDAHIRDITNGKYRILNLLDKKTKKIVIEKAKNRGNLVEVCDFSNPDSIALSIREYEPYVVAVIAYGEKNLTYLVDIIPHVPYIKLPTQESVRWATDKIEMRKRFTSYDSSITPKFVIAHDNTKETIETIEKKVGYPVVVKPTGLSTSLFVTNCFHRDELEIALKRILKQVTKVHKSYNKKYDTNGGAQILVEEYMEGEMYSMDGLVSAKGTMYFYPLVHVKTGKQIGFDDFFGYQRLVPTKVSIKNSEKAELVVTKAIKALGLRSTHFHIELMRSEDGWKVIEIAPRIGGFRHVMYDLSYGSDLIMNELLVRLGKKPKINKKVKGFTAVLNIFAKKEGIILKIKGLKKAKEVDSVKSFTQKSKLGDKVKFAKNGGHSAINITLFNKERSKLLADIRRVEQAIDIVIK